MSRNEYLRAERERIRLAAMKNNDGARDYAVIIIKGKTEYLSRCQLIDGQTVAASFKTMVEARAYLHGLGFSYPRIMAV